MYSVCLQQNVCIECDETNSFAHTGILQKKYILVQCHVIVFLVKVKFNGLWRTGLVLEHYVLALIINFINQAITMCPRPYHYKKSASDSAPNASDSAPNASDSTPKAIFWGVFCSPRFNFAVQGFVCSWLCGPRFCIAFCSPRVRVNRKKKGMP